MVKKATVWITMVLMVLGIQMIAGANDIPRISKEKLKSLLENPNVAVIDVRRVLDRNMSLRQIKGAVREDPENVKSWAGKYSKKKTIVLYCA